MFLGSASWIAPTLIVCCILATPVWGYIAAKNPFTKEVLDHGWTPVIFAMLISRLISFNFICTFTAAFFSSELKVIQLDLQCWRFDP